MIIGIFRKRIPDPVPALLSLLLLITAVQITWVSHATGAEAQSTLSYKDYAAVLRGFVDGHGLVDYGKLKAGPTNLQRFVRELARVDPKAYQKWPEREKITFWINAYNCLTLKAVLDHYPIRASFLKSLRFPKNSIRQIPGVWTELKFSVMGHEMTLDEIEHQNLRALFNEPRIHMALVCAALGCPALRNEPYTSVALNSQLDDQTRAFLRNPWKFRVDRQNRIVHLSPIFKWYGGDFVRSYGTKDTPPGYDENMRAVLNFISRDVSREDKAFIERGGYSVEFLDYEWSLNEKSK